MYFDFIVGFFVYISSCSVICFAAILLYRPEWIESQGAVMLSPESVLGLTFNTAISSTPVRKNNNGNDPEEVEISPIPRPKAAQTNDFVGANTQKLFSLPPKMDSRDRALSICKPVSPKITLHRQRAGGLRI